MDRLDAAVQAGSLRLLDLHFARWMETAAGGEDPSLLLAAALVSRRVGEGDVCADLREHAGQALFSGPVDGSDGGLRAPPMDAWRVALRGSPVVGAPGDPAPLILDPRDRLYLGRYWRLEHDLAEALLARTGGWAEGVDRAALREGLDRLFPPRQETDWQRLAAALAVLKPFCVISGGPGTGKTRTVTAILALLLEQAQGQPLRIGLAAPTGKAAARLTESIAEARTRLDLPPGIVQALPDAAGTLHRLLGTRPGRAEPRHGPDNPLHLDVLVVDEASMVDLPLMARLLAALRPETRLILLGDKDQLASVQAGMVLGDICGHGRDIGYSPELSRVLAETARETIEPEVVPSIADQVAVLRKSYRFGGDSGIGATARAVNAGDGAAAARILTSGLPDARMETVAEQALPAYLRAWLLPKYGAAMDAGQPEAVLQAFNRFRILCAVREGPFGVRGLNRLCEAVLEEAGLIPPGRRAQYPGRPLLVTSNDYSLGLYNGDVGMILPDAGAAGGLRAWFDTPEGPRRVLPPRLPAHETLFAMTVHKSQGSELDEVLLILPEAESRVVTRELLYTGITRARRQVTLIAREERLRQACAARVARTSGLFEALWGS